MTESTVPPDIQAKINYTVAEARFINRWAGKPIKQWLLKKKYWNEKESLKELWFDTLNLLLPCITNQVGACANCGWKGTVGEMEPDVDGDGSLGCPQCGNIIVVKAE